MLKKLIFILVGIAIVGFLGYNYIYKEHRNIAEEEAEYVVSADMLVEGFMENPEMAEQKYLNKAIAVTGKVTSINKNNLTLDNSVFCQFEKPVEGVVLHSTVKVKGRCIGFDNLLGEIKLDNCSILK